METQFKVLVKVLVKDLADVLYPVVVRGFASPYFGHLYKAKIPVQSLKMKRNRLKLSL